MKFQRRQMSTTICAGVCGGRGMCVCAGTQMSKDRGSGSSSGRKDQTINNNLSKLSKGRLCQLFARTRSASESLSLSLSLTYSHCCCLACLQRCLSLVQVSRLIWQRSSSSRHWRWRWLWLTWRMRNFCFRYKQEQQQQQGATDRRHVSSSLGRHFQLTERAYLLSHAPPLPPLPLCTSFTPSPLKAQLSL